MIANTDVEENWLPKDGASEGIRTLDTHVGNVMLYQAELRSLPSRFSTIMIPVWNASQFLRISAIYIILGTVKSHSSHYGVAYS